MSEHPAELLDQLATIDTPYRLQRVGSRRIASARLRLYGGTPRLHASRTGRHGRLWHARQPFAPGIRRTVAITPGDYYDYIDNGGPKPAISVIQDLDGDARG